MKRIILLLAFVSTIQIGFAQYCGNSGSTQCTASGTLTQPGFFPASGNLPVLVNGTSPSTAIQFKNFNTTVYSGFTITVAQLRFDSIGNLPAGLCWATDKANNTYNNQEQGCIKINGTTCSDPGVYKLRILVTATITGLGNVPMDANDIGLKYFLRVKNNGDADVVLDTLQTADFTKPAGYSVSANCVIGSLSVGLGANQSVCSATAVTLNPTITGGTANYIYAWSSTGNSLSCNNCANPTATITQNSTYRVTVTDANSATASASVSYAIGNCGSTCGNLFFSEYVEGSANNKALEIYNPTSYSINLNGYRVLAFINGSNVPSTTFFPVGTIAAGDVYVIVNTQADSALTPLADTLTGVTNFNGNDAIALLNGTDTIDVIGVIGNDPGTGWLVGSTANGTNNHTLVRNSSVALGTNLWTLGSTQWSVLPMNSNYLGSHFGPTNLYPCSFTAFLGSNQTVCTGTAVTLSPSITGGTANYTYAWSSTGNSLSCNNCANPTATITQNSTYRVTVTDANNATASASVAYTNSGSCLSCAINDSAQTTPGVNPTADNLPCIVKGSGYDQTLQVKVQSYKDTVIGFINNHIIVDSVRIDSVAGLPTGISFSRNPTVLLGGGNGCGRIYGLTNAPTGIYPLTAFGTVWLRDQFTVSGNIYDTVLVFSGNLNNYSPFGGYYVEIINQGGVCHSGTLTVSLGSNQSVCNGTGVTLSPFAIGGTGNYTYAWSSTGNSLSCSNCANPTATITQNSTYVVTVTDSNSVTASASVSYTATSCSFSVSIGSNQSVCNGTGVTLSPSITGGTANYTYAWSSTGNSLSCNNCANPTATITQNSTYRVTVTDANNATASASVTYTKTICSFSVSLGSNQSVCSGTTVTLSPTITGGTANYTYAWSSTGNSLSCNNCQHPTATITQNSTYRVTVTDANSATASASVAYTIAGTGTVQITANGPTTICAGQSVTLGTGQAYTSYNWSSGSSSSSITVNQQGSYTLTVTNNSGCSSTGSISVSVQAAPSAQSIIGNPSITPFQTYPYLVSSVNGITYTWSVLGGAIQTGQGTNSVNVIWGSTGPYLVTLVQANSAGCSDTSTLVVANSSCSLAINVLTAASPPLCSGDTALLIAQVGSLATYQWIKNGSPLAAQTNDTLVVTASGTYQVQVTSGSCTVISNSSIFTFQAHPVTPLITSNAGNNSCNTQAVTLKTNNVYSGYLWNTGATSDSISVNNSGNYTLTVTGSNGCKSVSQPYNLNLSIVVPNQVCVVSVDSVTGKNVVIWEKPNTAGVDSYFVYKETNQFNIYSRAGAIGVHDFSTFMDMNSNAQQQSDRYKLAVLDTCGNLTLQSNAHKTIHLTINSGLGGVWNLIWNHYEGFSFPSYNIYRGTTSNGLQLISTISSGNNSYTDVNPPSFVLYYLVEAVNPGGCTPTAKTESFSSSLSNVVQVQGTSIVTSVNDILVSLYPNPATNELYFEARGAAIIEINIYNATGCLIGQIKNPVNNRMDVSQLAQGVYMAVIKTKEASVKRRWVKM